MGASQRNKGARVEREFVNTLREAGIEAKRVPLSGACQDYKGDIIVSIPESGAPDFTQSALARKITVGGQHICTMHYWDLQCEVKAHKDGAGFTQLETWLGDNDALFLKRNQAEPMVVLPWKTWMRLIGQRKSA